MNNQLKTFSRLPFVKRISIPMLIVLYFIARVTLGLDKYIIIGFMLSLFLFGATVEIVAISFFIVAIGAYVLGWSVEANNYFSYVYISLGLIVIKYFYSALKDKKNHS